MACVIAGLAVAVIGNWLSGNQLWFLSIPAAIAIGWLFLADPTECEPTRETRAKRKTGK